MTTISFGRDVSTHELALQEIERLSKINIELVGSHNNLLISRARLDDKVRELEQDRSALAETCERLAERAALSAELEAKVGELEQALRKAKEFIENGIEFGFIRMPDEGDSAHETLPMIRAALHVTDKAVTK
jgi:hypothetical protein